MPSRPRLRYPALCHPRRAGDPHHGLPQGLPAALPVVPQPRRRISARPVLSFMPRQVHRVRRSASGVPARRATGWRRHACAGPGELCEACGDCAEECYVGRAGGGRAARRRWTMCWRRCCATSRSIETSGGGMTLSGGEPLAQIEFTEALLAGAKARACTAAWRPVGSRRSRTSSASCH